MPTALAKPDLIDRHFAGAALRSVTEGPLVDRICADHGTSTVWIEVPRAGGPYDSPRTLVARVVAAQAALPRDTGFFRFPDLDLLSRENLLVFQVPRARVLYELLEAGSPESLPALLFDAGKQLTGLHRANAKLLQCRGSIATSPAHWPLRPVWEDSGGEAEHGLLRHGLTACGELSERARHADRLIGSAPLALLHGRWSIGTLALTEDCPQACLALTGVDCWLGPREFDLGYLTGELLELAAEGLLAKRPGTVDYALEAAASLVAGYRTGSPVSAADVSAFSAHRALSHFLMNSPWRAMRGLPPPTVRELIRVLATLELLVVELERRL